MIVQINETTTVFLGGYNKAQLILVFSWITMTYQVQNTTLIKPRLFSSCAPIRKDNGQVKVVMINFIRLLFCSSKF